MEVRGWLHKRSSGTVKSWRRRFFILDRDCVLHYHKYDPAEKLSDPKGSLQITGFSDNAGRLKNKIPRQFDPNNAILFTTTDPNKQWFLVVAESADDKGHWTTCMKACFEPEIFLDLSSILCSYSIDYGERFNLKAIVQEGSDLSVSAAYVPPYADSTGAPSIPSYALRLVACFVGELRSVALMSMVCKSWNSSIRYEPESKVWTWLVRQGSLSNTTRWGFWCHVIGVRRVIEKESFNDLIRNASPFNKYEIEKDVNRAFGVSVSKRMTERRSILPPCMSESSLDDFPTKYRLSFGAMNGIPERCISDGDGDMSSVDSDSPSGSAIHEGGDAEEEECVRDFVECGEAIDRNEGDESNEERVMGRDARPSEGKIVTKRPWGHGGRCTMGWPSTPDAGSMKEKEGMSRDRCGSPPPSEYDHVSRRGRGRERRVARTAGGDSDENISSSPTAAKDISEPMSHSKTLPQLSPSSSRSTSPSTPTTPPALTPQDIQRKKLSLTRILQGISTRFESVGYCQGLDRIVVHCMRASRCAVSSRSFPTADLDMRDTIDEMRERECFSFLQELFEHLSLCDVYSSDSVFGLRSKIWILGKLFEFYCPDMHRSLEEEGVSMEIFSIGWIQTLFLYVEAMPAHTIDRIWDIFTYERSWVIVFQVAIAIMKLAENQVLNQSIDIVVNYFNVFPDEAILEPEVLLKEASRVKFDGDMLRLLEEQYSLLD